MKPKTKLILSSIILVGLFASSFANAALIRCGTHDDPSPCGLRDLIDTVFYVMNFLLGSATLVAIGYVLYGGLRMLLSAGNEEQVKAARSTVSNAIVGLIIVIMAFLIVTSVTSYLTGYSLGCLRTKFFNFSGSDFQTCT